jgi:hypothetical protein
MTVFSRGDPVEAFSSPLLALRASLFSVSSAGTATASSSSVVPALPAGTHGPLTPAQYRAAVRGMRGKGFLKLMPFLRRPSSSSSSVSSVRADNKFGMYLTVGSIKRNDFLLQTMDRVAAEGGNALVLDVKGSYVYFHTDAPMANEIGTAISSYDLSTVIAEAKARGLYTIGRFIALKDGVFVQQVPKARVKNLKTGWDLGLGWSDPAAPETLTYNGEILEDLLVSGIDEVNFDYIRYSTAVRPQDTGLTGKEKADRIETFLVMAKQLRDRVNPQAKLGMSSYAIMGWDYAVNMEPLGQDFVRFAPLLDIISPMAYPDTFAQNSYYIPGKHPRSRPYYLVWRTLKGYADLLGPEHAQKIRPWIQAYSMDATEIRDEIDAVYDMGLCGFTFWNANNNYAPAYGALKLTAASRPEECKE